MSIPVCDPVDGTIVAQVQDPLKTLTFTHEVLDARLYFLVLRQMESGWCGERRAKSDSTPFKLLLFSTEGDT